MRFIYLQNFFKILFFILTLSCTLTWAESDTCPDEYKRLAEYHTICLPPNPYCHLEDYDIADDEIDHILKLHNTYRSQVAMGQEKRAGGLPPASDMLQMVWDQELADIAQKWADNCDTKHDLGEHRVVGSFAIREKGNNPLVLDPDYTVDALKLPNQALRVSGESLQMYVAWRCPNGTQQLFCWPILAISDQSLASNSPVFDSRDLNLVLGHTERTRNKLFLSSPTKYTVEPSWPLVLVRPPFELLHRALTKIVFAQYCRM
ncbi:hypothetical protein TNCV_3973751 [Trichonephila clavipes]|nr:hypothetical protein TNCV_3973751 [Trichonephila clavipes]